MDSSSLARKIRDFLSTYAVERADFDPEFDDAEDAFASPDAAMLHTAASHLFVYCSLPANFAIQSSWESGGYAPYNDKTGRAIHDEIIAELKPFIGKEA